jgi:hypothetical protein
MSWHLRVEDIDAYLVGRLSDAYAASAEAHLLDCTFCQEALADREHHNVQARRRHDDTLTLILDRIDRPQPSVLERLLSVLGVSAAIARLTAGAPRLRHAWLAAGLAVLTVAVLNANLQPGPVGVVMFVVSAPAAPVIGIALTYGRRGDPAGTVAVVAPFPAFRLLLWRSVAVLMSWLPFAAVLTVALPAQGWVPLLWFLPALALTSLTLALSSFVDTAYAAGIVVTTWFVLAAATVRGDRWTPPAVWLESSLLFRPAGQALLVVLAVAGVAVSVVRRSRFDGRESA